MSNEEISALAREYGEEASKKLRNAFGDLSEWEYYNIRDEAKEDAENVLRFLLRRYALVEKEAVHKKYDLAEKLWIKSACTITEEFNRGRMNAIESLFPEIVKEVEK